MLIKTLVENTSISKDFCNEHGLSLYINARIKNGQWFCENPSMM